MFLITFSGLFRPKALSNKNIKEGFSMHPRGFHAHSQYIPRSKRVDNVIAWVLAFALAFIVLFSYLLWE
jgi:hypothetical protein